MIIMRYLFLILILGQHIISAAQHNDVPGFIIDKQGNRLEGLLRSKDWDVTPGTIQFKVENTNFKTYQPSDILAFGNAGLNYIAAKVQIDLQSNSAEDLLKYPRYDTSRFEAFLEELEPGLYRYKHSTGVENFFVKEKDSLIRLVYKRFMDDDLQVQEINSFKNQLTYLLSDCSTISSYIKHCVYKRESLVFVFKQYRQCKSLPTVETKKTRRKLSSSVFLGMGMGSFRVKGGYYLLFCSEKYNRSSVISLGGRFLLPILGSYQKHTILLEPVYRRFSVTGTDDTANNVHANHTYQIKNQINSLRGQLLYRYHFYKKGNSGIFSEIGLYLGFNIHGKLEAVDQQTGSKYAENNLGEEGLLFGVGYGIRRCSLGIRGETGLGKTGFALPDVYKQRNLQVLFTYIF